MTEGFIFNHDRCVACGACSAACLIENGWSFMARSIRTCNEEIIPGLPLVNISMACNHCSDAACMKGCPSSAFYRDPGTGSVQVDESKCIGCRYCTWNCPYEAPVLREKEKVIGKCNLCLRRLEEGMEPACSGACPTGALKYGILYNASLPVQKVISWFPEKGLDPALRITGTTPSCPKITPESIFEAAHSSQSDELSVHTGDWSLIAFSFLTICSVSAFLSSLVQGRYPSVFQTVAVIITAAVLSLFHLGQKRRAWMAVFNLQTSPLSREIAAFIAYSLFATLSSAFRIPFLLATAAASGLVLMIMIDAVYLFTDNRRKVIIHSGQAFISSLLIASFFSERALPFIFIGMLKLLSAAYFIRKYDTGQRKFRLRFLRMSFLLISGMSFLTGNGSESETAILLFLAGELTDRILFYADFKPVSITAAIKDHINKEYEKAKG